MATRVRARAGRGLVQLLWAVPVAVAALHAGPNGIGSAEACSGGEPGFGWDNLHAPVVGPGQRIPVATDGFVLLNGAFRSDAPDADVPLPWVRATTDGDEAVPGTLRVLRAQIQPGMTMVDLGWQSDEALAIGTLIKLSWSEAETEEEVGAGGASNAPASRQSMELEVVAEPAALPVPTAALGDWVEVRHGVGELVECDGGEPCGGWPLQVPTNEERVPGVEVSWKLPTISGVVAWEAWAETRDASDATAALTPKARQLIDRERDVIEVVSDVVAFADDAAEHCVVMVVKDLRTGEESRSEPRCQTPGAPVAVLADHQLSSCEEPPTPDSLPAWCAGRPRDERCAEGGQGGSGGDAGSGASPDDDSRGNGGDSGADAVTPTARIAASGGGCAYATTRGGFGTGALGLMLLLALQRRRRG